MSTGAAKHFILGGPKLILTAVWKPKVQGNLVFRAVESKAAMK
jgi:hypothetical protein